MNYCPIFHSVLSLAIKARCVRMNDRSFQNDEKMHKSNVKFGINGLIWSKHILSKLICTLYIIYILKQDDKDKN